MPSPASSVPDSTKKEGTMSISHDQANAAGSINSEFLVSGMTCSHCVSSVTEELSTLDSVENVVVELNADGASKVTVASSAVLDPAAVRAAISEAGYELVDVTS
ncbi:MAG: heavy-metal-associated domain-containing protein [Salinibacterium sp.]|nr:heavy-metal-associated domain-containing protein [Salinibacterium sp.]